MHAKRMCKGTNCKGKRKFQIRKVKYVESEAVYTRVVTAKEGSHCR